MNAYNEICGILAAMGANPEITENGVKVNAPTVNGFTFDQLSEAAKENVRHWYTNQSDYLERFQEDCENELRDHLPNSDLKIALSWLCCQGDGVNVYGRVNLDDFIPHWDVSEKEKRTMRFYCSKGLYYYDFTGHNRYSYSCKFMDIDAIGDTVNDFVDELYNLRNVNAELIKRFYSDMFDFFQELDDAIRDGLYDYIYNPSDSDISDFCDANKIYFDVDGRSAQ